MGGPGSGRRPWRLAVDECRAVSIGELCDGGRWQRQPQGEILWRARHSGQILARLTYMILGEKHAGDDLLLAYRYRRADEARWQEEYIDLACGGARRSLALCPGCGARVRTLYASLGSRCFICRTCLGLVYRRPPAAERQAHLAEVAGPVLGELAALPAQTRRKPPARFVEHPPVALARQLQEELPLAEQELRLWCLRLRTCGLSYRQIAALVESSKSSVARICAAGKQGIDAVALMGESLQRSEHIPAPAEDGDGLPAVDAYLAALHRHALRLGLYRHPLSESEERLLIPAADASK